MNIHPVLLGIIIVVVFGVGFLLGNQSDVDTAVSVNSPQNTSRTSGTTSNSSRTSTSSSTAPSETVEVDTGALSEGQRKLMSALGIDESTITITPAMVACAEASLGTTRVEEIKNGATPSFAEGLKLAACYK